MLKGAGATLTLAAATPFFRTGAGAATLRQTPTTADISGTSLNILLWSHFVPRHDVWFDQFVAEWGEANGVTTQVDHVNTAEIPAAIAAEIAAGRRARHRRAHRLAGPVREERARHDRRRRGAEQPPRRATADGDAQLASTRRPMSTSGSATATPPIPATTAARCGSRSRWRMGRRPGTICWRAAPSIKQEQGVQMGLGMSNEIDSRMAAQTLMWAYGAAIQDENENVTINSPETIAAVEFMTELYKTAMTPEVFGWNAASNNQLLVAGRASYILNSISAYRTAQKDQPETGADIFFRTPLLGPAGEEGALAHGHAVFISMIPNHSQNPDTAKEFLFHLVGNYAAACEQSELYNFPAWPSTVPDLGELARQRPVRLGAGRTSWRC